MTFDSLAAILGMPAMIVLGAAGKGALAIGFAFIATHLLRRRSSATRHAIWATAVLGHLVLVFASPLLPRLNVPVVPSIAWGHSAQTPAASRMVGDTEKPALATVSRTAELVTSSSLTGTVVSPPTDATSAKLSAAEAAMLPSALALLIAVWVVGALLVFARYLVGTARVARLARESERVADGDWLSLAHRMAAGMGITRPLTLLRGARLEVPVTWGIVYPVVFLPADADRWTEERRRFVLVHELAHVKRLDAVTQLLTQVTLALFWFDPLLWYAAGRIRTERERACDDQVLLHGTRASTYADELLDIVRGMSTRGSDPAPAFAALAMARRSELEGRMLAILDPAAPRATLSRRATVAMFTAALLLMGPLAALWPVPVSAASAAATADEVVDSGGTSSRAPTADAAAMPQSETKQLPAGPPGSALENENASVPPGSPGSAVLGAGVATVKKPMYRCTRADLAYRGSQISVHGHSDDDPASSYTEAIMKSSGHCTYALLVGNVTLSTDLTDVSAVPSGGRAFFHELTTHSNRELTITRAVSGALERRYLENGQPVDAARGGRWLADLLRTLVMKGGFGVEQRVAQLRASGGIAAVLEEGARVPSSSVKRAYYEKLLRTPPRLTQGEADRVLRDAAAGIESAGDLAAVVRATIRDASPSPAAVEAAVGRIQSDGDRRSLLQQSLRNPDPEMVRAVLRATAQIASDGDKTSVLTSGARVALRSEATRSEFYAAAATIYSDGDKASVLMTAVRHTPREGAAVRQLLASTASIGSDGDKTAVLLAAVNARLMVDARTREAFIETARTISSDGDRARVMTALLR